MEPGIQVGVTTPAPGWEAFAERMGTALRRTSTEVYFVELATYRFLCANEAALKSLGYSQEELSRLSVPDISERFDARAMDERLEQLRTGAVQELVRQSEHRRKDGTTYPVELRLILSSDESGAYAIGLAQDISDRLRAEEELTAVFESSADVIMLLNSNGDILRVNRGALRTPPPTGLYKAGRNVHDYVPDPFPARPTIHDELAEAIQLAAQGKSTTLELGGATPHGNEWFDLTFSPVGSRNTAGATVAAVLRDVTVRRENEAALLREQRVLTEIASSAAAAASPHDLLRALRRPMGRLIPRPWIDFGYLEADCVIYPHPSGHQIVTPHDTGVCEAIETGQSHWYGFDEPSPGAVLLRDAGVFAASLTASSLGGEPFGLLLVSSRDPAYTFSEHDLSLIKVIAGIVGPPMANLRAAEDVRRQRALYDTALSSLAEAVILLDESGQAVFSNSAGTEIVEVLARFPHEPAVGMAVDIPPQVADDFLAAIVDRRQRAGSRIPVTVDGQQRWYNYEFIPLEFEPPRTLAIARDVSAEVQRELAEERHREEIAKAARLSALGGLIGGVAHELNNPLTAILGFAEIMQAEGAGFAEEIAVIQEEARRARDIVRDLLFIVRPGPVQFGEVPLNDVVRHVERLRRSAWRQLGVTAQVDVDEASPTVTGNAHHLTQVLLNLVTNAEDALAGSEQPRLAIRVLAEAGNAVLTVSDNGVGMDSETARHIFEPFFTTKAGKGTGLGLSVIHNILQIHHGCIDVSSAPGEGSTFTLTIPLAANKTSAAAPEPAGSAIAAARRARVLVIDDEPAVRSVSQRLIESLGHDVVTAANVDEALGAVCRTDFDSIICDYRLGSETATQFVDRLPAERAGSITETMIIATGATTDSGVSKLVERCGLRLLPKPFGLEQLRAVLEG